MKDSCNKGWVRVIMDIVRMSLRMKTIGRENINPDGEPSVFVCNHSSYVGPMAGVIYTPVRFRPWIHDSMLDRNESARTMERTFKNRFRFLGTRFKNKLIWWITKPLCGIFQSFDPIPVSRTNAASMMGTIRQSVEALGSGVSLLIFPENPAGRYDKESFRHLSPAFALLGKEYFKQFGQQLLFYPIFADRQRRTFSIGNPVVYQNGTDSREEVLRIAGAIQREMVRLSEGPDAPHDDN